MKKQLTSVLIASSLALSVLCGCGASNQAASQDAVAETPQQSAQLAVAERFQDKQYVLYLGTNDKDSNQPVFSREESMEKAKEILVKHFGGYTIQDAEGGWVDDKGTLCQEYTLVIYLSDTDIDKVYDASNELIDTFHQSSVLIQENPTRTEFYGGKH